MDAYELTSQAWPKLGKGQAEALYKIMLEDLGGGPATMEQILEKCKYRHYEAHLIREKSIQRSVEYHLNNWLKAGIARKS